MYVCLYECVYDVGVFPMDHSCVEQTCLSCLFLDLIVGDRNDCILIKPLNLINICGVISNLMI